MNLRVARFARILLLVFLLGNQWRGYVSFPLSAVSTGECSFDCDSMQPDAACRLRPVADLAWQTSALRTTIDSPNMLGKNPNLLQLAVSTSDWAASKVGWKWRTQFLLGTGSPSGVNLLLQHSRLQL